MHFPGDSNINTSLSELIIFFYLGLRKNNTKAVISKVEEYRRGKENIKINKLCVPLSRLI